MVMHHLDDHLAGRDRAQHIGADRLDADLVDELLDDRQGDIGLNQGDAYLAQRFADIRFRQRAAFAQPLEDVAKLA